MQPETAATILISVFALALLGLGVWALHLSDELRLMKARFDRLDSNVGELWADRRWPPRGQAVNDHPPRGTVNHPRRAESAAEPPTGGRPVGPYPADGCPPESKRD